MSPGSQSATSLPSPTVLGQGCYVLKLLHRQEQKQKLWAIVTCYSFYMFLLLPEGKLIFRIKYLCGFIVIFTELQKYQYGDCWPVWPTHCEPFFSNISTFSEKAARRFWGLVTETTDWLKEKVSLQPKSLKPQIIAVTSAYVVAVALELFPRKEKKIK